MTRIALVGIIYNRCLTVREGVFDESAAMTLMSNDTENAANCGDIFHELWSQVLELCIGMYLLAIELGWVCIFPPLVVLCKSLWPRSFTQMGLIPCSHLPGVSQVVSFVTENLADRQMALSKATQMRISRTKAVLDSIKNIKMMGLVEKMEAKVQSARRYEMKQHVAFYRLLVAFFVSCRRLSLNTPEVLRRDANFVSRCFASLQPCHHLHFLRHSSSVSWCQVFRCKYGFHFPRYY